MKRIKSSQERRTIFEGIRRIVIACCIFVLFFKGVVVDAGMNDSSLSKNRLNDIFALASFQGQSRIFYLNRYTLNDIVSYCIDLGVDITTDRYHSTEDFGLSYLPSETIEYIRSISYFGYRYPGHEDYHYYMATQELIWEYISGGEVDWSYEASMNGTRIDVEFYKNEILSLRNSYLCDLNFDFQNGNIYEFGDKVSLNVISGDLSWYEVVSSNYSKVWIEGNTLQIEVADKYVGEEKIVLKRKERYPYKGKLYYYDTSQRLISVGNLDEKYMELTFKVQGKSLEIQLLDGETGEEIPRVQTSFEGAIYELYDMNGSLLETLTTDVQGQALVSNLPYGDYVIKQVDASLGYLCNEQEVLVTFDKDNSLVYLEQFPIYREVELLKLYDEQGGGLYQPEVGISFSIYDIFGNDYGDIITNEEGIASILLGYGQYIFQQNNTTEGYAKVSDFEVFIDSSSNSKIRYDLIDQFIECQLKVLVLDQEDLAANLGSGFLFKVWDEQNERYLKLEDEDTFSTDESGFLIFPFWFSFGKYRIEQVGVPDSFLNNFQIIEVEVNDYSPFTVVDGKLQLVVETYQELLKGKIRVVTEQEIFDSKENDYGYRWKFRPNVVVDLISPEDLLVYGKKVYESGAVVQTITTNEKGIVELNSLYLGNYCLVERESKIKKCFDLTKGNRDEKGIFMEIHLQTLLDKMAIEFENYNQKGKSLEGVLVEVLDNKKQVFYTGITDEDGKFKVKNLPSGQYCFHQKKIGSDYLLNEKDVCVEIDSSQEIWHVQMINELAPTKWIPIPNTYEERNDILKLVMFFLIGIGGFLYRKKINTC